MFTIVISHFHTICNLSQGVSPHSKIIAPFRHILCYYSGQRHRVEVSAPFFLFFVFFIRVTFDMQYQFEPALFKASR